MNQQRQPGIKKLIWIGFILPLAVLACSITVPTSQLNKAISTPLAVVITAVPAQPPAPAVVPTLPKVVQPQSVVDEQSLLIALYKQVNPAVVNITIYTPQQGEELPLGQGSGFVYDQSGNIATDAHVVHGADQIEVSFWDGSIEQAKLVGEDLNSDLAIIKVEKLPPGSHPLPLGNLDNVQVGQTVVAIGNPFGLEGTLTRGIVSAVGRTIPALTPFSIPQAVQTDAPINPGNSGGPLLNLDGEVIGINAQIETSNDSRANSGVGFAIPVSILQRVLPELAQNGHYDWAWLGVRGTNLTPTIAAAMQLPIERGAYITSIIEDGPASKTELRGSNDNQMENGRLVPVGGDVVTAINGSPINSFDDLLIYVALQTSPGQQINLTVNRDGKMLEIPLTLEARPANLQTDVTIPIIPTPPSP